MVNLKIYVKRRIRSQIIPILDKLVTHIRHPLEAKKIFQSESRLLRNIRFTRHGLRNIFYRIIFQRSEWEWCWDMSPVLLDLTVNTVWTSTMVFVTVFTTWCNDLWWRWYWHVTAVQDNTESDLNIEYHENISVLDDCVE